MTKKTKNKSFTVQTRTILIADIDVEADTLEEALGVARGLKLDEIAKPDTAVNFVDWNTAVTGGWGEKSWDTKQ